MTKLLDQAVEVARNLPSDAQDDIARVVLQLAGADDGPPVTLSDDERAAISVSKEAAARHRQPELRAPPQDVIRKTRPFVGHEIAHFGAGQVRTERRTEIGLFFGVAKDRSKPRAVGCDHAAGLRLAEKLPLRARLVDLVLELGPVEISARQRRR